MLEFLPAQKNPTTIRIDPRSEACLSNNITLTCGPASSAPAARPGTEEGREELWVVCHYRDDWNADGLILGSAIDAIYIEPRVQLSAWPNPRNRELRISMTAYKLGNVNCKTISVLNSLWFSQNWGKKQARNRNQENGCFDSRKLGIMITCRKESFPH